MNVLSFIYSFVHSFIHSVPEWLNKWMMFPSSIHSFIHSFMARLRVHCLLSMPLICCWTVAVDGVPGLWDVLCRGAGRPVRPAHQSPGEHPGHDGGSRGYRCHLRLPPALPRASVSDVSGDGHRWNPGYVEIMLFVIFLYVCCTWCWLICFRDTFDIFFVLFFVKISFLNKRRNQQHGLDGFHYQKLIFTVQLNNCFNCYKLDILSFCSSWTECWASWCFQSSTLILFIRPRDQDKCLSHFQLLSS